MPDHIGDANLQPAPEQWAAIVADGALQQQSRDHAWGQLEAWLQAYVLPLVARKLASQQRLPANESAQFTGMLYLALPYVRAQIEKGKFDPARGSLSGWARTVLLNVSRSTLREEREGPQRRPRKAGGPSARHVIRIVSLDEERDRVQETVDSRHPVQALEGKLDGPGATGGGDGGAPEAPSLEGLLERLVGEFPPPTRSGAVDPMAIALVEMRRRMGEILGAARDEVKHEFFEDPGAAASRMVAFAVPWPMSVLPRRPREGLAVLHAIWGWMRGRLDQAGQAMDVDELCGWLDAHRTDGAAPTRAWWEKNCGRSRDAIRQRVDPQGWLRLRPLLPRCNQRAAKREAGAL